MKSKLELMESIEDQIDAEVGSSHQSLHPNSLMLSVVITLMGLMKLVELKMLGSLEKFSKNVDVVELIGTAEG